MTTRMKIAHAVNLFGLIVTVSFIATVGTGFVALNQLKVGGARGIRRLGHGERQLRGLRALRGYFADLVQPVSRS